MFMVACDSSKSSEDIEKENEEIKLYQKEIERLKQESNESDGAIRDLITSLSDIEANLSEIRKSREELSLESSETVSVGSIKENIFESIEAIGLLMEKNQKQIKSLRYQLRNSNDSIGQLNDIVKYFEDQLGSKNDEILSLRNEIADLNIEYLEIFDAYLEKADEADMLEDKLNKAYFAYGSFKELKEAGVLTKEGGFVGLGKIEKLRTDFNKEYFKRIDIEITKTFPLEGKKIKIVTTHPSGSYSMDVKGENLTIKVLNAFDFWSASKYLVVVID